MANVALAVPLVCFVTSGGVFSRWDNPLLVTGSLPELVLDVGLLVFGALLPDADTKRSILGRYVCLPGQHRTWTHALWAPALLVTVGILFCMPLTWLGIGWGFHILTDVFSRAGVCLFWPITQYRRYQGGAFVAKHHRVKLYRTGKGSVSEDVFLFVVIGLCAVACVLVYLWPFS